MKRIYFLASLAALALASCSNEDLDGVESTNEVAKSISFSAVNSNVTRATVVGSTAASKLNNHFVVYGTKHSAAEDGTATNDALVYNMYNVEYGTNTAGTTASNTSNWEYVGKKAYSTAVSGDQSVKYWDYTTVGYTFYAFSSKDISYPAATTDLVSVEKITSGSDVYKKGYTVTVKNGANMNDLYYADRVPVAKADYGKAVNFTFRNMSSQVRVGFYEAVPGYSVTIDKFYYDADAAAPVTTYKAMDTENTTNFVAALQNVVTNAASNAFTVTYYDNTDASTENRATVTNTTVSYNYNLTLGSNIQGQTLGTTSSAPTWDTADGAYTSVYPFEANTKPMLIRVDYTLTSTDGSNEVIKVKNARVVVPVQYCQWKSNYAYTYLFKISDKSNGTTGTVPTDPDDPTSGDVEGLYPITFDAVVVATDAENYNQETITTVASNSVTTYSNGKIVTTNNEYKVGTPIYVVNMNTTTKELIEPKQIGTGDRSAQIYSVEGSGISEATVTAQLTGSKMGLTLTAVSDASLKSKVPAADGTDYVFGTKGAVKFTPATEGTYAYVYATTAYVAPTYEAAGDTYDASTTYYFLTSNGVYYAASGLSASNYATYKSQLYVQKTAGTPGVYDVKVIKVVD